MDEPEFARIAIVVPQVGEAIAEARLIEWQVEEGDSVRNGDVLFVVDTEKAEVDVEAFVNGVVEKILVGANSPVMPGQRVGNLLVERSKVPPDAQTTGNGKPSSSNNGLTSNLPHKSIRQRAQVRGASPLARRRARELGVDIAEVVSAFGGRVSAEDVEAFFRETRATTSDRPQLSRLQKAVADATTRSKRSVPHFYLDMVVDMTAVLSHRQGSGERRSITAYVVAACVLALREHSALNVSYHDDGLVPREEIAIGVAVATDEGLLVPVLADLRESTLSDIQSRLRKAIQRAAEQKLTTSDHGPRSMVVTNLGMFGIDRFHPIINQPDPFILAVGKTGEQVVAVEGEIRIRPTAVLSLSADHRALDGMTAARFLSAVTANLELIKGSVWS